MDHGLSLRAQKLLPEFALGAPPEQQLDPDTTIDLSCAVNEVLHPELLEFFKSTVEDTVTNEAFTSSNGGNARLRDALAAFFNAKFDPIHIVKPEHIVLTTGTTDVIEDVIHAVCDDGDSVLVPGPHWLNFEAMLKSKANVNMVVAQPPSYTHWENYLLPSLQAAYDFSDTKSRIKAVMICNPANLLSRCYSRKNILELMEFCQERGLHLIIEEVGSHTIVNSGDEKAPEFTSVLSLTEPLVPAGAVKVDPSRVHMVWSASEFLGLDGLRVGCIVSQQNPHLITALSHLCAQPPSFATLNLISLLNWAQLPTLFALKMERLTQSYNILAAAFRRHDVCFIKPTHGIFVLAKLTKEARTEEDERRFYEELAKRGVRVAYGTEHRGVQNDFGWCRIRYGVSVEVVSRAVQIIERFLEKRQ